MTIHARGGLTGKKTAVHQATLPMHMLPTVVDWRGTEADSPVKNQAACGSCWVCYVHVFQLLDL